MADNWQWYKDFTRVLEPSENELNRLWGRLRTGDKKTSEDLFRTLMMLPITKMAVLYQPLLKLLAKQYPDSAHFLPGDIPTSPEEDASCEPDEESE